MFTCSTPFRFANTITAQFCGHTHNDEFMVYYDYETNTVPINVAYIVPCVTTYTGLNPSFRFYTLDGPYDGASMVRNKFPFKTKLNTIHSSF